MIARRASGYQLANDRGRSLSSLVEPFVVTAVLLFSMGVFGAFDSVSRVGDTNYEIAWAVVYLGLIFLCVSYIRQLAVVCMHQKLVFVLMVWTLLSTTWSLDPAVTIRRSIALACTTLLGFYLGLRYELRALLRIISVALAIAAVASVLTATLAPEFGVMTVYGGAWRGVFSHKGTLAVTMVLAVVTFGTLSVESRRAKWPYIILTVVAVALVVAAKSVTALAYLTIVCCIAVCYRMRRLRSSELIALSAFALLCVSVAAAWCFSNADLIFSLLGRDRTLTGRTVLWGLAGRALVLQPWNGYGFNAFWLSASGEAIRTAAGWDAPHSHNGFLDLSLDIGIIGLGLFLAGLMNCFRHSIRYAFGVQRRLGLWPILFLSVLFLQNLTETTTVARNSLFWILYTAVSVSLSRTDTGINCSVAESTGVAPRS